MNLAELPVIINDKPLFINMEVCLPDHSKLKIGTCFLTFIDPKVHKALIENRSPFECYAALKAPTTHILRKVSPMNQQLNHPHQISTQGTPINPIDGQTITQNPPPLANMNIPMNYMKPMNLSQHPLNIPGSQVSNQMFKTNYGNVKNEKHSVPYKFVNPMVNPNNDNSFNSK